MWGGFPGCPKIPTVVKRLAVAGLGMLLLALVSYGLYLPYRLVVCPAL